MQTGTPPFSGRMLVRGSSVRVRRIVRFEIPVLEPPAASVRCPVCGELVEAGDLEDADYACPSCLTQRRPEVLEESAPAL